jgi:fructokinase
MTADHGRHTGRRELPPQIAAAAAAGDAGALETLARYEHRMARALASVINMLDPDVIVLGGGMSNIDSLYETVPPLWARYVFGAIRSTPNSQTAVAGVEPVRTRLVKARHGDARGVRGAAWL